MRVRGPNSDDWTESLALFIVYSVPGTFSVGIIGIEHLFFPRHIYLQGNLTVLDYAVCKTTDHKRFQRALFWVNSEEFFKVSLTAENGLLKKTEGKIEEGLQLNFIHM